MIKTLLGSTSHFEAQLHTYSQISSEELDKLRHDTSLARIVRAGHLPATQWSEENSPIYRKYVESVLSHSDETPIEFREHIENISNQQVEYGWSNACSGWQNGYFDPEETKVWQLLIAYMIRDMLKDDGWLAQFHFRSFGGKPACGGYGIAHIHLTSPALDEIYLGVIRLNAGLQFPLKTLGDNEKDVLFCKMGPFNKVVDTVRMAEKYSMMMRESTDIGAVFQDLTTEELHAMVERTF